MMELGTAEDFRKDFLFFIAETDDESFESKRITGAAENNCQDWRCNYIVLPRTLSIVGTKSFLRPRRCLL